MYSPSAKVLFALMFFVAVMNSAYSQCGPVDHAGADLIISTNTTLGGEHTNIGKFQVSSGVTLSVDPVCKYLIIEADTIIVAGIINGNYAGDAGGSGGVGGGMANGSGNPGQGGFGGLAGTGPGGGNAGLAGLAGGTITQICGGLFCSGNRDGLNGGGGGGGGASGGAYGGIGAAGGWGAYGSGFTGATGGDYGQPGNPKSPFGSEDGVDIAWGSGGGGAGAGGGGWSNGDNGGRGGNGGAMVRLTSAGPLTLSGSITCSGEQGYAGGNGGGESTDDSYTCSSSGYSSCGICSESVFDAAGGAGGGGGGGSGGGIMLQAQGPMVVTGILHAKGGDGGPAGLPRSTIDACFDDARGGGSGSGGRIKIFSNPCYNNNISPTTSVNAGLGGEGVTSGIVGNPGTYRNDLINPDYVALAGGAIALTDPEFCFYGDVPPITSSTAATGGVPGILNYQWQYSITNATSGFSNIPGQINVTYDPGMITQTTWYRRKATSGICEEFSNVVVATVLDCSSIEEQENININVYPNPANDEFFIEIPQLSESSFTLHMFTVHGLKVIDKQFNDFIPGTPVSVTVDLPSGVYLLQIIANDFTATTKISIE